MAKTKSTRAGKPSVRSKRRQEPTYVEFEGRWYKRLSNGRLVVEGHQLNQEQERLFRQKIAERRQIAEGSRDSWIERDPIGYAHRFGLSDVLWEYQPHAKADDRLLELARRSSNASSAIASMRGYSWCSGGSVVREGCALLDRLMKEAELRVQELRYFIDSMIAEPSTKLHHWTARKEKLEKMEAQHG